MNVLVANDDGINSQGIRILAQRLKQLGDVWVVAPERTQNAMGRAITLHKPLRLNRINRQTFSVNGTPSDCITLAVGQLLKKKPIDLVVSGINKGLNLGDDISNSGTVAAALEGAIRGIPSMAISLDGQRRFRFQGAATVALEIAKMVLKFGLPADTLLNVNVPDVPGSALQGIQFTSLSRRRYLNPIIEKTDPRGGKYYWIAGEQITWNRGKHSDAEAVAQGFISITPLHFDMTQYQALTKLRQWETNLNKRLKTIRQS